MKRIVMVFSLVLVVLLAACGTQNRQAAPVREQTQHIKPQMNAQMKTQPQLHVSSVETNLPVNKHNVQNNESISDIAERYHVDINEFLRLNPGLARQIGGNPNSNNGQVQVPNDSLKEPIPNNQTVTLPANDNMAGYEEQVLALTNQERQKAGLSACAGTDANLNRSARAKSQDMANNNYFSHQSPTYGDPFAMMRNFGVQYQSAGENIAMGQPTPAEVVQAWMNSPGHRKNILNGSFTHLGVGYVVQNGKPYWTQQFIGK
ncbi:CAP domain-containing protein [Cohnella cholangitidis]|uniref:LysM peptidoglycan-binding domain-containing protein n=1 Tax=Cohnella cholangitidis TaxID=2598458 RepID=A0A7G5BYA2_9BACL|nr:CAP domain-containing protein [Cohnella cholangitidis]QMV41936.1 LysM peptidoglycan-binding domain-containing protein [Cohnella cholangitidis]